MNKLNGIWIALALALVSCGGGTTQVEQPQAAQITGSVEITGAPLASLDDSAAVGEQDASKWALKLIDPVEDVDGMEIPVENTTFNPAEVTVEGEYLLEVSVQPALDLSGGGQSVTAVAVSLPVTITESSTTQVFATLEVIPPVTFSSVHSVSQSSGGMLRLRYTVETDGLRDSGYLEIDWSGSRMRRDTNGDDQFGDEEYYADSDRDGISDNFREQLRDRPHHAERFTVDGALVEIDRPQHRILVGDRWYRVSERTEVWNHTQRVHLGDLRAGQQLRIRAVRGNQDGLFAEEIRILRDSHMPPLN